MFVLGSMFVLSSNRALIISVLICCHPPGSHTTLIVWRLWHLAAAFRAILEWLAGSNFKNNWHNIIWVLRVRFLLPLGSINRFLTYLDRFLKCVHNWNGLPECLQFQKSFHINDQVWLYFFPVFLLISIKFKVQLLRMVWIVQMSNAHSSWLQFFHILNMFSLTYGPSPAVYYYYYYYYSVLNFSFCSLLKSLTINGI